MSKTIYKNNKKKISISESFFNIASTITAVYVFFILTIFPLYTHDMYFDILGARYVLFKITTAIMAFLLVATGIIYLIAEKNSPLQEKPAYIRFIEAFKISNLHKYINICDVFVLVMIISMAISTIGAHKVKTFDLLTEGFYGNAGRYQGLECWLMYAVLYVCISRTYRFKKWHIDFAIVACVLASLWCVTDYYQMNIFGFLSNVSELQKHQFSSSVGNLNTLTNYTCMGFGLALTFFVLEKNIFMIIFYAICSLCCLAGNVFGISDNAAVGTAVVFVCIPFFAVKNRREFIHYILSIALLSFGLFIADYMKHLPNAAGGWGVSSILLDTTNIALLRYAFIPLTIIAIALIVFYKKFAKPVDLTLYKTVFDAPVIKSFILIWSILMFLGFAFVVYIFVDVNVLHIFHEKIMSALSPISGFLTFNDDWGTHRGHNWRIAFENFKRFNPFHKLFGYGPDTYLVLTERTFYEEMVNRYGEVYDSAHNEYINYLICEGVVGLISYIGIVVSSIVYGAKRLKENKLIAACIVAVIAYAGQAIVNIAIPITTPIYFTLMFMLVAEYMVNKNMDAVNNN